MFSNAAMRALLPGLGTHTASAGQVKPSLALLAENDPVRQLVERALAGRKSAGPVATPLGTPTETDQRHPSTCCCATLSTMRRAVHRAMVVARNLVYLNQVHTT
jgi:hypothetical protein